MKFKRRLKIEKGMIDLTPMVNVFFLLFIFFLFTSSFIFQPGIRVSLPKAVTSEVVEQDNVALTITKDDKLFCQIKNPEKGCCFLRRSCTVFAYLASGSLDRCRL